MRFWRGFVLLAVCGSFLFLDQRIEVGARADVAGSQPVSAPDVDAPALVAGADGEPFAAYYAEILKAEGLNFFATAPARRLSPESLKGRKVVLLTTASVSGPAAQALADWVEAGGLLIAVRPGPRLQPLLGLRRASAGAIEEGYLLPNPALQASRGIVAQPLRIHAAAEPYELVRPRTGEAAATVAQLHARSGAPLPYPAITVRRVGRGHAAAFAFDLARSVALTRQGNPRWTDAERDGSTPRRPNDLFFPDHVDLERIGIPQADEQQRLLANLILSTAPLPLPRLWYLPDRRRAAIIMAGDDHGTGEKTVELFATLAATSPAGCRLDGWECLRATAYLAPRTQVAPKQARKYDRMGFELGAHVDTGCKNQDGSTLTRSLEMQLRRFRRTYRGLPLQRTHRIHCLVWSGWADVARIERRNGVRFDLNYYHWPPHWIAQRPGFMTGSGFPMPFVDQEGTVLDIYQAATHLVNESGVPQREGVRYMIARALGPEQFFGAFGAHYDFSDRFDRILLEAAQQQGVALISAEQMLSWLDGRNRSRFHDLDWRGAKLRFDVRLAPGAENASVMLPARFAGKSLATVVCDGRPVVFTVETIKGLDTAFFPARSAACEAVYAAAGPPPRR